MRSFAIDEHGSSVRALYATLVDRTKELVKLMLWGIIITKELVKMMLGGMIFTKERRTRQRHPCPQPSPRRQNWNWQEPLGISYYHPKEPRIFKQMISSLKPWQGWRPSPLVAPPTSGGASSRQPAITITIIIIISGLQSPSSSSLLACDHHHQFRHHLWQGYFWQHQQDHWYLHPNHDRNFHPHHNYHVQHHRNCIDPQPKWWCCYSSILDLDQKRSKPPTTTTSEPSKLDPYWNQPNINILLWQLHRNWHYLCMPPSIWFSHDCCPHQQANLELLEHRPHVGLGERGVLWLELDHVLFTCCDSHRWQLLFHYHYYHYVLFACSGILDWLLREKNNWSVIFEVRIIFLMLTSSLIPKKSITLLCSASSVVTKTNITSPL